MLEISLGGNPPRAGHPPYHSSSLPRGQASTRAATPRPRRGGKCYSSERLRTRSPPRCPGEPPGDKCYLIGFAHLSPGGRGRKGEHSRLAGGGNEQQEDKQQTANREKEGFKGRVHTATLRNPPFSRRRPHGLSCAPPTVSGVPGVIHNGKRSEAPSLTRHGAGGAREAKHR